VNWLDLFISIFLLAAIFRGTEVGFTRQFFSTSGFFIGLFLGAWLDGHLIALVRTPDSRAILALSLTIGIALLGLLLGEFVGWRVKFKLQRAQIADRLDRILGAALAVLTVLIAIWLGAAVFRNLPSGLWQRQVRGSRLVSVLTSELPSAPNVLTGLGHLIDPNSYPQVFSGLEPTPKADAPLPDLGALNAAIAQDRSSIVQIEGKGCGGIVEGSGFVAGDGEVLTNAHVVAGVHKPFVLSKNTGHAATVVFFDPDLDIAVLRVNGALGPPLTLNAATVPNSTAVAMLGYPEEAGFTASPGIILDSFTAVGRNIYNKGQTQRQVYSMKADVREGNSGGPIVTADGAVVGIVFAKSTGYDQVGYALSLQQVVSSVDKAKTLTARVDTGDCAE